jgi:NitT/TauT family transport system permease protein
MSGFNADELRDVGFLERLVYFLICPLFLVLALEIILRVKHVPSFFIPLPSQVLHELFRSRNTLFFNGLITAREIILGFSLGVSVGSVLAIAVFYIPLVKKILMPFIFLSQIFPKIAFAPILLIWFGFGIFLKVSIGALTSFFPIMINLLTGLNNVSKVRQDIFKSLCANGHQTFFKLYLPSCLPYFFAGLKTGLVFATYGVIVGEFTSSHSGLGYLILAGSHQMNTTICFASLIVLGMIVILFYSLLVLAERKVLYWKEIE